MDPGPAVRSAELRDKSADHGRPWTMADRKELARLFIAGLSMAELMERSRGGIRAELVRQGWSVSSRGLVPTVRGDREPCAPANERGRGGRGCEYALTPWASLTPVVPVLLSGRRREGLSGHVVRVSGLVAAGEARRGFARRGRRTGRKVAGRPGEDGRLRPPAVPAKTGPP